MEPSRTKALKGWGRGGGRKRELRNTLLGTFQNKSFQRCVYGGEEERVQEHATWNVPEQKPAHASFLQMSSVKMYTLQSSSPKPFVSRSSG